MIQKKQFWAQSTETLLSDLGSSSAQGLSVVEAQQRLEKYGANVLVQQRKRGPLRLFLGQLRSPITIILLFATAISIVLKDYVDSTIILVIVLISALLGFYQEYNAGNAVEKLLEMVRVKAWLIRDGEKKEWPIEAVVPGDVVCLTAGDVVPADAILLSENALSVDESSLTGESFPVEKSVGVLAADCTLGRRTNSLWMGTHVVSGSAKALVVQTGVNTEFGAISARLQRSDDETDFERGVRRFGNLLMEITVLLLLAIFSINLFLEKPVFDSFVFSLALAVGMTPQLLPAIISVNLSHGARIMAARKVIVKKLSAIENFGTMNVLCSDKTGTITSGQIELDRVTDAFGNDSPSVYLLACLNASFQSSYQNPIDKAVLEKNQLDFSAYRKLGEIPYNFVEKRLAVLLQSPADSAFAGEKIMISKGALKNMLMVCDRALDATGRECPIADLHADIQKQFESFSQAGCRTLGVAYKVLGEDFAQEKANQGLVFAGFICLSDPLKAGMKETVAEMKRLGVSLKIITGDNPLIAANIARQLSLDPQAIMSGEALAQMSDSALVKNVVDTHIFAEIEPNQKERIILALKKSGQVVGYMGDGINDASAIHSADVGISVNTAADVAKDAAKIVLLEQDLNVLIEGVKAGRATFANTMKYVFMATSANFGNMFSMAGASLFLPFLPLRSTQVLLTNMLTDFPEMQIAADNVDDELLLRPQRWDIAFIRKFMLVFGVLSSVFDYLTFGILLWLFHANEGLFQSAWFTESVISASLIVFVVRSRQRLGKSRPGKGLSVATLCVVAVTLLLPYTPLGVPLGLFPLPWTLLLAIFCVVTLYVGSGEWMKRLFYKKMRM